MKSKLASISSLAALLIAAVFLALPQRPVSAQTCRDAAGNVIPCPPKKEKKTPTPVRPTRTPTPTPTLTPTPTEPPDAGAGVSANPPGGAPDPGGEKGFVINWRLWGGLILGLLIVGFIIINSFQARRRLGKSGGEKGVFNAYNPTESIQPSPEGDLGGPDTSPQPHLQPGEQSVFDKVEPFPDIGDLGAVPPDIGDLGAVPPDSGDLGAIPPDVGDLGGPDT